MSKIIGLVGSKYSGKTTSFKIIKKLYPKAQEVTLARKIKIVCSEVFDIPLHYFEDQKLKEKKLDRPRLILAYQLMNIYRKYDINVKDLDYEKHIKPFIDVRLTTPRKIAQYVGTDILRNYNNNIHIESALKDVNSDICVITDIRFNNEFDYFKKNYQNFIPLYIFRELAENKAKEDKHPSEQEMFDFKQKCVIIDNNSDLENLKINLRRGLNV